MRLSGGGNAQSRSSLRHPHAHITTLVYMISGLLLSFFESMKLINEHIPSHSQGMK